MIVRLLADAEADLESIGHDIARDNLLRAVSFVAELRDGCNRLAGMLLGFRLITSTAACGIA